MVSDVPETCMRMGVVTVLIYVYNKYVVSKKERDTVCLLKSNCSIGVIYTFLIQQI